MKDWQEKRLKILCPYCNGEYTAKMLDYLSASMSCETCGPTVEGTIDIYCDNCEKLVYRKEI